MELFSLQTPHIRAHSNSIEFKHQNQKQNQRKDCQRENRETEKFFKSSGPQFFQIDHFVIKWYSGTSRDFDSRQVLIQPIAVLSWVTL